MLYSSSSTVLQVIQQNLSSSQSTQVRQQVLLCNIHEELHICPVTVIVAYDFYLKTRLQNSRIFLRTRATVNIRTKGLERV